MRLRLVRPTQSANSITLGTVADSRIRFTCAGSMMITCAHMEHWMRLLMCQEPRHQIMCAYNHFSDMANREF